MQGYFSEMYRFICKIIENKDIIKQIKLENTANNYRQFKNIVINVEIKHSPNLIKFYLGHELTKDEHNEAEKINYAENSFYHNRYKWECHSWVDLVRTAESMYYDLQEILSINDVKASFHYNILGYFGDNNFYSAEMMHDAIEMDAEEYLMSRVHYLKFSAGMTIADIIRKLDNHEKKMEEWIDFILNKFNTMEKAIKNQKNSYILSKLIENKAMRKDYGDNEILIEAYDAYIDIKKAINSKIYS